MMHLASARLAVTTTLLSLSSSQGSGFIFGLSWRLFLPFAEGGSSWAQHEPAALTLRAGTSRQQPAGRPPSSSRTGKHTIITPFVLQIERRDTVRRVSEAESNPPQLGTKVSDVIGELRVLFLVLSATLKHQQG